MIVEAVGVSANVGLPRRPDLAKALEAAMSQAVKDCYAQGVTDPDKIRAQMMEAREQVLGQG
jgi:hypothetical protein